VSGKSPGARPGGSGHTGGVPSPRWGQTPRESILLECRRRGAAEVAAGCIALLGGGEADDALVIALAVPAGRAAPGTGRTRAHRYWLRVWAARGLLYAWDDRATGVLIAAMTDESWRVREMAARVVARHRPVAALAAVAGLRDDPVPRVRAAAARAAAVLTAGRA
jgi:hypothetical protein